MRLAISNLAWDVDEDLDVVMLLQKFGINAIDIVPGKYFPDPVNVKNSDIKYVKQWWADQGIEIAGMQSLLFNTSGLNIFGNSESRNEVLEYLKAVFRVGAGLGVTKLVFGSPKNRDRSGLNNEDTLKQAVSFFRQIGHIAQDYGVIFCLEPNPTRYGANFMTTSEDTAQIVQAVDHESIKMQFDSGSISINKESAEAVLMSYANIIGHIHLSEPDLLPLGDGGADHQVIYQALQKYLPRHLASIEMFATKYEPHLQSIERALTNAVALYQKTPQGTRG